MIDTRKRNFIFTIQENQELTIGEQTLSTLQHNTEIKYLFIGGNEQAPTTGKQHRHCLISFKNKKSIEQVISILSPHHVEEMKGTILQSLEYATKDNKNILFNSYNIIENNDNFETVSRMILEGAPLEELLRECPKTTLKYYNNIRNLLYDKKTRAHD